MQTAASPNCHCSNLCSLSFSYMLSSHNKINSLKPWHRKEDTDENNQKARAAYQALLIITAKEPEYNEFEKFFASIKEISRLRFNYDYQLNEVNWLFYFICFCCLNFKASKKLNFLKKKTFLGHH